MNGRPFPHPRDQFLTLRLTICPQVDKGSGHMWREAPRGAEVSQQAEAQSQVDYSSTKTARRPLVSPRRISEQLQRELLRDRRAVRGIALPLPAAEIGLGSLLASPAPREFAVRGARGSHGRALPSPRHTTRGNAQAAWLPLVHGCIVLYCIEDHRQPAQLQTIERPR